MMGAAIFLLLFTAVYLASPAVCGEEQESRAVNSGRNGPSLHAATGPNDQTSPPDDCFCCCSHVLASKSIILHTGMSTAYTSYIPAIQAPFRSVQTAYDPPRVE